MNGKGEKGLIAIAVAFLLVISGMSIMQLLPTGDDAEKGGEVLTDYTTTRAFGTMMELNSEPEDVEVYMDEDGDGEPEIDNGTIDEAGSLDPEEILDEDGDGEPEYDEIAGPDTPLGEAINSTESTGILDYTIEDLEEMLDEENGSIEGDVVADGDTERAAEYDPEEDASEYDEDVLETDDIDEYLVLWGEGVTPEATEDPAEEEHDDALGLTDFEADLAEYDASGEDLDTSGMSDDGRWSRDLYWTYETVDTDADGFPEYAYAILLINWTYDGDDDDIAEFRWMFLAGYLGYDNDSNNRTEHDAVLVVGMHVWDLDDDGTPDRVREWNWGRIRTNADEDLAPERRMVFAAYRKVDGEGNRTVEITKWGRRYIDADSDGIHEEDTAVLGRKDMSKSDGGLRHIKRETWLVQQLDLDDDARIDVHRAVVIGHQRFDNDTDGNPEYTSAVLGGFEESWGPNFSRRVLVMTTEGFDVNDDGVENSNETYVWWDQEDLTSFDGDVLYGRTATVASERYDNNSDGNPEWVRRAAGIVEHWDPDTDGVEDRNLTAAAMETAADGDSDGNPELTQRAVWAYEFGNPDGEGNYSHHVAAVAEERTYDNDSDGNRDYHHAAAGGYESWDNDTDGTPEYEAILIAENETWHNGSAGEASGYVRTLFAVAILDGDADGNPEHARAFVATDRAVDQNDDGYIDRAWGVIGAHERSDPEDDGNVNYMANFLGAYDFRVTGTEEYNETSASGEAEDEVDGLIDSDGDGEPDQDQGTITGFVDEALQEEIGGLLDGDGDENADFSELSGDEPINDLSMGGETLLDYTPLNVTEENDRLQPDTDGEPQGDRLYSEETKARYGMDEDLTRVEAPVVDYSEAVVLIDNLSLEHRVLWWDGENDPTADEDWIEGGLMAYGQQMYDNDTNGIVETQTSFAYQIGLEGIEGDGVARHRQAVVAMSEMRDDDQDGNYEFTRGAIGYLETHDNDTDGFDEHRAAIWIGMELRNVSDDGKPQVNSTLVAGLEQEFSETSEEHPFHVRAIIGSAYGVDEDCDGIYEYAKGEAAALEMYDNDTDGNASYIGVILFGQETWDGNGDGHPEAQLTYIWILEASDDDNDGNHERLWAVITTMNTYDNDSNGDKDEAQAMQAGCLKVDADDDGTDDHIKIYVAGGSETAEGTEWFVWYHEGVDTDDDGTADEVREYALYMKNLTTEQTIVNAVHLMDADGEVLYFGAATSVDADADGNKEHEAGGNWILETSAVGVTRGGLFYTEKNDTDDDGNPEVQTTTVVGFRVVDRDMDGAPESQTLLVLRNEARDANSNGHAEYSTGGAFGAHVEGNGTDPTHGYLYVVYAESQDLEDDGTESNSAVFLGGYAFRDNGTHAQKDWEAVKVVVTKWNDENMDGVQQEEEKEYVQFGARVHRD